MENQLIFGVFNVPPISESLTASFTTVSFTKDMLEKIYSTMIDVNQENAPLGTFDKSLKGILSVPKREV